MKNNWASATVRMEDSIFWHHISCHQGRP